VLPQAWLEGPDENFAAAVADAGFGIAAAPPSDVLITAQTDADAAIASAETFAASLAPGQEALVVHVLHAGKSNDWEATRTATVLWAYVRHAALIWAPRRLRINAVGIGIHTAQLSPAPANPATQADIASTVLAMWQLPSMTGQIIRLG
jgi:hypothetical protein